MTRIQDLINLAASRLQSVTNRPQREACLLLAHTLDKTYEEIYFAKHIPISEEQKEQFLEFIERRLNSEPLSKIRSYREFWSLRFRVTADTLDPRPDSESLIESVLESYKDKEQALRILDLGTGTGCLLLSLLHEYPNASGVGVDLSEAAALIAKENAHNLNLEDRAAILIGNWGDSLKGTFDVIISNPPYISLHETLPIEVEQYDPPLSLYGGNDGLQAYRELVNYIPKLAHPTSKIFLEMGAYQYRAIRDIFNDYIFISDIKDLQGHTRGVVFCIHDMRVE